MKKQINCCIAGISGFVGQTLLRLIANHPNLELTALLVKEANITGQQHVYQVPSYSLREFIEVADSVDVLILATPADISIELIKSLYQNSLTIIDLSGAFRLSVDDLKQWYGLSHSISDYMDGAPYGLSPFSELTLGSQKLVANPGCYATCALLTLLPLLQTDILGSNPIIIDAKSGVSGAGKKANTDMMFCEITGNFMPYKVGKHQHLPEIKKNIADFCGKECEITFVTQLLPIKSGIAMSIYCQASSQFMNDDLIAKALLEIYGKAYSHYPLLQYGLLNQGNNGQDKFLLSLNTVVDKPNTHISFHVKDGSITLFSFIDNLWKGAASQAIENINTLYQLPVDTGLQHYKGALCS